MATTLAPAVAWPAPSQSVTRALFCKGLAKGCTSAHLQAIFSQFGTVTDCQIARHRSGRSAGFAIVSFLRHDEAVAAMHTVDNMMFMGRRLSVKWFSPERALEGSSHGVDANLNLQALQHALQLTSQLQPNDLMAQLAQMLESPRLAPQQQQQNPHVAAWLDNYFLAQHQRDSPLAQPLHDAAQPQPQPLDLLNLSALSLADVPGAAAALGIPQPPGLASHPTTPAALDIPDGAVFVTATSFQTSAKKASAGDGIALAHSRLAKWCTAPGSAGGRSSNAPSYADDGSSASETASVHASDDSSIAPSTVQIPNVSCEVPSCCTTEGTSPALVAVLSDPGAPAAQQPAAATVVATTTATSSPARHGSGAANAAAAAVAMGMLSPVRQSQPQLGSVGGSPVPAAGAGGPESEELLRNRVLAAAAAAAVANSRPGGVSSDPGNMHSLMMPTRKSGPSFTNGQSVLPGAPPLAPLRTAPSAPAPIAHHHHHHHHHAHHSSSTRGGTQSARQSASSIPPYNSCPGGGPAATAPPPAGPAGPDSASLQQALRLQQALAEQARTMSAQQQYVDALAKLAAARDQVMAAASLLTSSSSGGMPHGGLPLPPALAAPHHLPPGAPSLMGPHGNHAIGGSVNPYMTSPPAGAPAGVPDLSTLLMLQNAAAINRPLY